MLRIINRRERYGAEDKEGIKVRKRVQWKKKEVWPDKWRKETRDKDREKAGWGEKEKIGLSKKQLGRR